MGLEAVELVRVRMRLRRPFAASHGTVRERDVLLVRAVLDGVEGWGECAALPEPTYSAEYVDGAHDVLRRFLGPAALAARVDGPDGVAAALGHVAGHRMAKAALEAAVLDAWLRARGTSLAAHLGATASRVPAGVAVGLDDPVPEAVAAAALGYRRVKVKIEPGRDLGVVAALRAALGDGFPLQVDANGAYTPGDSDALAALDEFGLLLVEQPFAPDRLRDHAALAARLRTPVCLDESLGSAAAAADALDLGACSVVNLKPGRVGGVLEARRVHDACVERGSGLWVGGMLETGVGRAVNVALAALPGVTLPGDVSASDRYWDDDLTEPFVLGADGTIPVPAGPGIGVAPRPERLRAVTVGRERVGG